MSYQYQHGGGNNRHQRRYGRHGKPYITDELDEMTNQLGHGLSLSNGGLINTRNDSNYRKTTGKKRRFEEINESHLPPKGRQKVSSHGDWVPAKSYIPCIVLKERKVDTGHENETLLISLNFSKLYRFGKDVTWKIRATSSNICFYKSNINEKIRIIAREQETNKLRMNQFIPNKNNASFNLKQLNVYSWSAFDATIVHENANSDDNNNGLSTWCVKFQNKQQSQQFEKYFTDAMENNEKISSQLSPIKDTQIQQQQQQTEQQNEINNHNMNIDIGQGGNLMGPRQIRDQWKNRNNPNNNKPPLVPPNARFDPIGPGGFAGPDPDHFKPPNRSGRGGFNDGLGGFGGGNFNITNSKNNTQNINNKLNHPQNQSQNEDAMPHVIRHNNSIPWHISYSDDFALQEYIGSEYVANTLVAHTNVNHNDIIILNQKQQKKKVESKKKRRISWKWLIQNLCIEEAAIENLKRIRDQLWCGNLNAQNVVRYMDNVLMAKTYGDMKKECRLFCESVCNYFYPSNASLAYKINELKKMFGVCFPETKMTDLRKKGNHAHHAVGYDEKFEEPTFDKTNMKKIFQNVCKISQWLNGQIEINKSMF